MLNWLLLLNGKLYADTIFLELRQSLAASSRAENILVV